LGKVLLLKWKTLLASVIMRHSSLLVNDYK
jgi:hypothetical protein